MLDLRKAMSLDTTQVDISGEIAKSLFALKKYQEAGDAYHTFAEKSRQAKLLRPLSLRVIAITRLCSESRLIKSANDKTVKPADLQFFAYKADSAITYVERKLPNPNAAITYLHAQVKDFEEGPDRNNIKGLAKPFYEQYIQLITAKGGTPDDDTKSNLADAYVYLGTYAEYKDKDEAKALDYFNKAKEVAPTDPRVVYYFAKKGQGKSK